MEETIQRHEKRIKNIIYYDIYEREIFEQKIILEVMIKVATEMLVELEKNGVVIK